MSESAGSTLFSDAGLQSLTHAGGNKSVPIVRGVLMAASGVLLRLSSSFEGSNAPPASNLVANDSTANGLQLGTVNLLNNGIVKQDFVLMLNGHKGLDQSHPNVLTASFDMTSPNYFANVLNTDPFALNQCGHYLYTNWDVHSSLAVVTGSGLLQSTAGAALNGGKEASAFLTTGSMSYNAGNSYVPNYEAFTDRFTNARSPWVVSQQFGGSPQNLFRVWALDSGAGVSTMYKLSIENIVASSDPSNRYGTFDLVVRDWNDTDTNVKYLEQWRGLSLNPDSDRYIANVIGDMHTFFDFDRNDAEQRLVVEGTYENMSNLIRIEVDPIVDQATVDPTALPLGYRGPSHLVTSGSAPLATFNSTQLLTADALHQVVEAPSPMRVNITNGSGQKIMVNPQLYWGTQFEHPQSVALLNGSTLQNKSLKSFAKYFPEFSTTNMNFVVGDNAGAACTAQNGVVDSDRFNNNMFTLERVAVVTSSVGIADPNQWASAAYVRNGNIPVNDVAKTRALLIDDFTQSNRRFLKFSFYMQGGFDGTNVFDRDESEINNNAVVADMETTNRGREQGPNVVAYTKALQIMQSTANTDVQLLAVPGIRHPVVTDAVINTVEERFDALAIVDIEQVDNNGDNVVSDNQMPSVNQTAARLADRQLDSSFAAAYFPDCVITDPTTQTNVVAPPSVAVLGAIALNDKLGQPWFAPAGFTRGALGSTVESRVKLNKENMDALYDVNVNPIVAFPGNSSTGGTNPKGGTIVWGQKTLQRAASALDRVNVRRLLINIRRNIRDISQTFVFEPGLVATQTKWKQAVEPVLKRVQGLKGLDKYKVIIDTSTTTQADIDNNRMNGKIIISPTKTAEFVSLDFVVSNSGVQTA